MLIENLNEELIEKADNFSDWFKLALCNNEMTVSDMAKELRSTRQTVSAWLRKGCKPSWASLRIICETLGVDAETVWNKWFK